jgi:AraC-like DNA-binding protein
LRRHDGHPATTGKTDSADMIYRELAPPPALADTVECLWSIRVDSDPAPALGRVFPDGCVELVVHLGPPWSWRPDTSGRDEATEAPLQQQPPAFVVGQLAAPLWLLPSRGGHSLGVRFRPGRACGVVAADLAPLADTVTTIGELWGEVTQRELLAALDVRREDETAAAVLADVVGRRLAGATPAHPSTLAAVDTILERRGSLRIAPLARAVGWSDRQLERRFQREVGCLPGQLARTVRFQHLLSLVAADRTVDWAGLAWDSGFADQAHLIREFRRFTGATPGRLQEEALALARRFVTRERLERYFRA